MSVPTRAHELLSAPPKPPDAMKRYGLLGGGTVLGGGGIAVVVSTHLEWLTPLLPDLAGATLLAVGGGLLMQAAKMPSASSDGAAPVSSWGLSSRSRGGRRGKDEDDVGFQVEVIPLNDEVRYGQATATIASGGRDDDDGVTPKTFGATETALDAAEKKERDALKAARAKASDELAASLEAELSEGLPARRLRQKLEPRLFVIDFDTRARTSRDGRLAAPPSTRALLDELREMTNLLLRICSPYDEVVLRVTSPGGPVTDYGLAAAHFSRLKAAGVRTTACVDLVAASGGYMIACAASKLLAAPFSIVGSIGVVAQAPNVHKLLDANGVEVVQRTAGEYKRTINIFQPNTAEGLKKFDEELALIHSAFITHVQVRRPFHRPFSRPPWASLASLVASAHVPSSSLARCRHAHVPWSSLTGLASSSHARWPCCLLARALASLPPRRSTEATSLTPTPTLTLTLTLTLAVALNLTLALDPNPTLTLLAGAPRRRA